jgi:hypothetical protein
MQKRENVAKEFPINRAKPDENSISIIAKVIPMLTYNLKQRPSIFSALASLPFDKASVTVIETALGIPPVQSI